MTKYVVLPMLLALSLPAAAADPALVRQLAAGEGEERIEALGRLTAQPDPLVLPLLEALAAGNARIAGGRVLVLDSSGAARDGATGETVSAVPADAEEPVVNNRMRRELAGAIAALKLTSPDRAVRLASARAVANDADAAMLPHIEKALAAESDDATRELLVLARATLRLASPEEAQRLEAVKALAESRDPATRTLLLTLLEKKGDGWAEPSEAVRIEAQRGVNAIQSRLARGEWVGRVFTGVSLGSILLLAALGLAITYGVMGVINMAHGELLMIGAYATYAVQGVFRTHFPGALDWYLVAAVPVAFATAALVGMAMERTVIRFLYGRPLETLLATWGISLVLIQASRVIFGAQNVEVANPAWMSGGIQLLSNVVLPWNRIAIIAFSVAVLLLVWSLLNRTRLGMFVRAVTQNRPMAGCVGVPTARVDTLAFGLGAGIAGLGGVALSQVSNVGPDMGQSYIVDSFMVVVLGGVGQLAGAVWAALGLGVASKFLEGWTGAVIAKILVLVFIIVFIQKRPQGLFALKGRFVEA